MRIEKITVWSHPLELKVPFGISGGRSLDRLDTTLVEMTTDQGITGWGESCPWGADYLPAFPEAVRAGILLAAPGIIGLDPRDALAIGDVVSRRLRGQPSIATALDMAAADIAARAAGVPLWRYLGGRLTRELVSSGGIGQTPGPEAEARIGQHRANGVKQMSAKANGRAEEDIAFIRFVQERLEPGEFMKLDVNGGWTLYDAMRVAEVLDHRILIEQPCASYEDCRNFVRLSGRPVYLDETVAGAQDILRASADGVLAGVNLKLGRLGGPTPTRLLRDLCASLSLPMFVQDTGGSQVALAATCHMASGVPTDLLISVWDCAVILRDPLGSGGVDRRPDCLVAGDEPGLGVTVDRERLGIPFAVIS
ncbi:MAG: hypothetical protein GC150_14985 [Rhizobiales bacterium]|nr:hypothetical protein [Hyphomicrobiales bacterium]